MKRHLKLGAAAFSAVCLLAISAAAGRTAAAGGAIFVTTTAQLIAEDGQCSLPEAIHAANFDTTVMPVPGSPGQVVTTGCPAGDGADTIQLIPGATFTMFGPLSDANNYIGPTATPIVSSDITIEALGAKIQHSGSLVPFRAFAVGLTGTLTLREIYIKGFEVHGGTGHVGGGGGLGAGGAVYVEGGRLTVEQSTFEQNGALGGNGADLGSNPTGGGGGGGLGGDGGGRSRPCGGVAITAHGGGGGGSRANGSDGCALDTSLYGWGGGRLASGPDPCGGPRGERGLELVLGGDGSDGECLGGGGGGGEEAQTAFDLAGHGGKGQYGGGGGGGGADTGDGGDGGFGGGGGSSGMLLTEEGGGGDGGDGGFGAGGGAGPDEHLSTGGPGQGGTFGGDAGLLRGGGGAGLGGAIFGHNATITVRNSTFFNNYADRGHAGGPGARDGRGAGGAIFLVGGSLAVVHATLSGNATGEVNAQGEGIGGGGIVVYNPTDGTPTAFYLWNTILAGNGIHECYTRNSPYLHVASGNLIVDGSAPSVPGQTHEPCQPGALAIDPGLEPLELTLPGRTPTMGLPAGSSAIDAAGPYGTLPFDQRSVQRPTGFEDIGAFEAVDLPPTTTITLTPSAPDGSNGWYKSTVGVTVSAADDGAVAQTRCVLDPATVPATLADLPDAACALTSVGADGEHTIYAASIDTNGNAESPPVSVPFKLDKTAPTLAPALSSTTVVVGQTGVTASAHATDPTSGVASSGCDAVDTSTPGVQTLNCTATDNAGNTGNATLTYVVEYRLLGFFAPVPRSKWKAGQTVPIKIALADGAGTRIPDAAAAAIASACRVKFSATGAQSQSATCMKYDPLTDQFVYTWNLGRKGTGTATITVTIGYPGSATTTKLSEQITITA